MPRLASSGPLSQGLDHTCSAHPAQGWHREGAVPPLAQAWPSQADMAGQTLSPGPGLAQSWPARLGKP
jgi:hypothetical protein